MCTRTAQPNSLFLILHLKKVMKHLVIFDLDGTLLNTIADLAQSTNYALKELGYPTHEEDAYRFMVGNGINKLFERALPKGEKTEANVLRPYPGIPELLTDLQTQGIQLAVASNKYQAAAEKLIAHYFPSIHFVAVFGQREGIPTKPAPVVVREILKIADMTSTDTLYVGDSGVDMQTAINAGVTSCGVTWGFRPRTELEAFHPDYMVERAKDIEHIVNK